MRHPVDALQHCSMIEFNFSSVHSCDACTADLTRGSLRQVLASVSFQEPRIPVYSNVTGTPFGAVADIPAMLARQLVEPVLWENTITALVKGMKEQLFELGPGAQIKAMVKRIDMGVWKAMRNVSV